VQFSIAVLNYIPQLPATIEVDEWAWLQQLPRNCFSMMQKKSHPDIGRLYSDSRRIVVSRFADLPGGYCGLTNPPLNPPKEHSPL
jgi:hypothetical protein